MSILAKAAIKEWHLRCLKGEITMREAKEGIQRIVDAEKGALV